MRAVRVSRSLFLLLLSACDSGPPKVATIPPQPSSAPPTSTPSSPPSPSPSPSPSPPPPMEEPDAEVPLPICGWVDPKTAPHRTQPNCNDANPVAAVAPNCRRLAACDNFTPKKVPPEAEAACLKQTSYFKLRVGEEANRCLLNLSSHDICDACNVHACLDRALKHACLDPTADATCVQIQQKCPAVAMDECRDYLSGMMEEGRRKMLSCISNRCGFGLYACAEGLGL